MTVVATFHSVAIIMDVEHHAAVPVQLAAAPAAPRAAALAVAYPADVRVADVALLRPLLHLQQKRQHQQRLQLLKMHQLHQHQLQRHSFGNIPKPDGRVQEVTAESLNEWISC